jgi:hypothetical protein
MLRIPQQADFFMVTVLLRSSVFWIINDQFGDTVKRCIPTTIYPLIPEPTCKQLASSFARLLLTIVSPLQQGALEAGMYDDTFRTASAMLD